VNYSLNFKVDKNGILTIRPNRAGLPADFSVDQVNAISIVEVAHKSLNESFKNALLKKL